MRRTAVAQADLFPKPDVYYRMRRTDGTMTKPLTLKECQILREVFQIPYRGEPIPFVELQAPARYVRESSQ